MISRSESDLLSILVVSYNAREFLRRCLQSIRQNPPSIRYEVLVIDNESPDASADMVAEEFPEIRLIRTGRNEGYGVAINLGVRQAEGSLLMFLNPDMEVFAGSLDALLEFLSQHARAGVVGPRLVFGDGSPQSSIGRRASVFLTLLEASRLHLLVPSRMRGKLVQGIYLPEPATMQGDWISGACHLIPRHAWDKVGPLTEETFCGFDDYDYCFRARKAGFEVWICAESVMLHNASTSVRKRWSSWEVERLATHNTYVVMSSHWPEWRVKLIAATELVMHLSELLRTTIRPRHGYDKLGEQYSRRVQRRVHLLWGLLTGREQPIRRFQPQNKPVVAPPIDVAAE
jgi:GT2 family glycosyltransferase